MKLDNKYIEVVGGLGEKSIKSTISQEKLSKLWDMLQNPYKNNIGSIVREITSNCFDSHTESQVEDAVRIKFSKDESNFYVSFIDVGIGMSPDRVEKIYSTYLESTKEDSNDFIGAFGIGSKSPLSYQDVFHIITRYEGTEYKYMMRKGADGPVIDLINSKLTSERNGTEIKIYIKNETDLAKFLKEVEVQLHYFNNVVVDLSDIEPIYSSSYYNSYTTQFSIASSINNIKQDYNIIDGNTFKYRTNTGFEKLHLCIGTVYYPIDYQNLGISEINVPFALKFDIGELSVIQTREDVRYTDEVVVKIKSRIKEFKEEVEERLNKKADESYLLTDYIKNQPFKHSYLNLGSKLIDVSSIVNISKLKPIQIEGFPFEFKTINDNKAFMFDFLEKSLYNFSSRVGKSSELFNSLFRGFSIDKSFTNNYSIKTYKTRLCREVPVYFDNTSGYTSFRNIVESLQYIGSNQSIKILKANEGKYSTKKNKYLFEGNSGYISPSHTVLVTIPDKTPKLGYNNLKDLYKVYNNEVVECSFKDFIKVLDFLFDFIKKEINNVVALDYDKMVVPEKWWKEYKAKNHSTADYDRTLMAFDKFESYGGWDRKNHRYNIEDFFNLKEINILITKDQQAELCSNNTDYGSTSLEKFIMYVAKQNGRTYIKTSVKLYATANRNYDKVLEARKENSNIYSLQEFLSNKKMQQRILSKVATLVKIETHIRKFNNETRGVKFSDLSVISGIMNDQLKNDYEEICKYVDTHESNLRTLFNTTDLESLMKEFDDVHVSNILYDSTLVSKLNNILKFLSYSKIHCISHDVVSIKDFIYRYKADKVYHTLHPELLRTSITLKDIFKVRYPDAEMPSDYLLQKLKDDVHYDGYINTFNNKVPYTYSTRNLPVAKDLISILLIMKFEEEVDFTIPEDDVAFTVTAPVVTDEEEVVEEIIDETIDLNV